jgi:hypothetical protein
MAVTTTRKVSAFVLVLKDIHSRNPGTALRSSGGLQGSLGKGWPEVCLSEPLTVIPIPQSRERNLALPVRGKLREESRSVPQASLGEEWLEGRKIDSLTHWSIDSLAHFICRSLVFAMIQ